jgi:hypothetical protein
MALQTLLTPPAIVKPISPFSLHQQLLYLWAITDLDSKKSTMLVGKCFRFVILMIHLIV